MGKGKTMTKISYILPCYNVGRFIADTLGSLYAQGMSEDDFEVICVNDCSTDDTREVIEGIQATHGNLTLLNQPRNLYSGAARNRGLGVARGEYIWFIDADDLVKPGTAPFLLEQARKDDLDILMFNYDEFRDGAPNRFLEHPDIFRASEIRTGCDFVEKEFGGKLEQLSLLWLRLVRRAHIERFGIRFPDLYISQDCPFAWEALLRAEKVKSIPGRYYNFRSSAGSITANKNTARKAAVWAFEFPVEMAALEERLDGTLTEPIRQNLEQSIRFEVNHFARRYLDLPASEKPAYFKAMNSHRGWLRRFRSYLSRKNRIIYASRLLGERVFARTAERLTR
jgi:glycosyltransferase involved in cell wall biosynthesis